jgi:hypothetical protein
MSRKARKGAKPPSDSTRPSMAFMEDVKNALLSQPERPTYKRARAAVKAAVDGLDNDKLKSELEDLLPTVLAELKQALAPDKAFEGCSGAKKRRRVQADNREGESVGSEAAYEAAVQRAVAAGEAKRSALEALLLARTPPHDSLIAQLMPPSDVPSSDDIPSAVGVCSSLIAAAGGSDAAPALSACLEVMQRHIDMLASTLLSVQQDRATDNQMARLRSDPGAYQGPIRMAHQACEAGIQQLAAMLALHGATFGSGQQMPLVARPGSTAKPALLTWRLAFMSAQASAASHLAALPAGTLAPGRCRTVITSALKSIQPLLMVGTPGCSNSQQAVAWHLWDTRPEPVASQAMALPCAALRALGGLAVAGAWTTQQPLRTASLAAIAMQRTLAHVYHSVGDTRAAASARCALDDKPFDARLLQWLQRAAVEHAAATRCVTAAHKRGASGAHVVLRALLEDLNDAEFAELAELWRAGAQAAGGHTEAAEPSAAQDDDLFVLDGAGRGTAFDESWGQEQGHAGADSEVELEASSEDQEGEGDEGAARAGVASSARARLRTGTSSEDGDSGQDSDF